MSIQSRVRDLVEQSTPPNELKDWVRGKIPSYYKRLNIPMSEAVRLAKIGAMESVSMFNTTPFFTQSMLLGAVIDNKYKTVVVVTPSQYGKSWICGEIAIWLAYNGKRVRLGGETEGTTDIIMHNVMNHMQSAHQDVKNKILEYKDKVEKLQTSVSKKKLTFTGGGMIETVTLGATSGDPHKFNRAIGRGGCYIIDECAKIPDDALVEVGRREFSNKDGNSEKELLFMISNPHQMGYFYSMLTDDEPEDDTLIVWLDARTSLEEGNIPDKERIYKSQFFKNDGTCQKYFLCELEQFSENSMFKEPKLEDFGDNFWQIAKENRFQYFLGIDSAYKGDDNITCCLSALDRYGQVHVLDMKVLDKGGKWDTQNTPKYIVEQILPIISTFHVKFVCVDEGYGVYLLQELEKYTDTYDFYLQGIVFQGGTTKERKNLNHYSAKYGQNKRSEMHMDLQQLLDEGKLFMTQGVYKILKPEMDLVLSYMRKSKVAIIDKHRIKKKLGKSPDELDSTLLSVHALILYNVSGGVYVYQRDNLNVETY